ncbi:MAG TPA: Zn-ribbon domain-containing OB-fold protein [Polyangiaceae bacterium]|nr:Zn-ribbon domain-containing OB-fold protein [Polyangiaceae bacterium]
MPAPQYAREIPRRYRLEGARCNGCSKVAFPARRVCPSCHGDAFAPITLLGKGKLVTWTVIHVAPSDLAMQSPYVVGIVELAEGVRVTAQVVDCDPTELTFGTPLEHVFRRVRTEGAGGIIQYGYKFTLA